MRIFGEASTFPFLAQSGQSACFGSKMSQVRILQNGPFSCRVEYSLFVPDIHSLSGAKRVDVKFDTPAVWYAAVWFRTPEARRS